MNPHNQTTLLIVMLGVIAVLAVLVLKRRGMRAGLDAQSPTRARTVTTRIQTMVKLARHPGAKTDFPKLRVTCKVAAGTPINPEPGDEIDLSAAFRQVAAQLCDPFASKTRVKYSVALQESVQGRTIPIETPQMTADLWQDGLEDILSS